MGTDIYLFAEKQFKGTWRPVPSPEFDEQTGKERPVEAFDVGRPYALFSVLSGSGVGLMSNLSQIPTTFKPRGFPDDMNDLYKETFAKEYEPGNSGDWGASWATYQELEEFDWDQLITRTAYVESRYQQLFRPDRVFPPEFPKDGDLYHGLFSDPPAGTAKVEWVVSLREHMGDVDWFLESLAKLDRRKRLRIIYWFNS